MARDDDSPVYSTDGGRERACPTCGRTPCACPPVVAVEPAATRLRMRLERKGRGGKVVTLVYDLPHNPDYFARLGRQLKAHCGTGGALTEAGLELQGDQRDKAQAFLEGLGFTVRRSGG